MTGGGAVSFGSGPGSGSSKDGGGGGKDSGSSAGGLGDFLVSVGVVRIGSSGGVFFAVEGVVRVGSSGGFWEPGVDLGTRGGRLGASCVDEGRVGKVGDPEDAF